MSSERSQGIKAAAIVVIMLVMAAGIASYASPLTVPRTRADDSGATPEGIRSVADAISRFALELYSDLRIGGGGNIFLSPYSIFVALAMVYEGASGQTAQEIQSVFHFPNDGATLRSSLAAIYNALYWEDGGGMLRTANALWIQRDYPVLGQYLSRIERYYGGKAINVDFVSETERARQTINDWAEYETNNKIQDLLAPGSLDRSTRLVLTNAIYYQGMWAKQFSESETRVRDFMVSEGHTVRVPMMSRTDDEAVFNYLMTENVQVLEMQYMSGDLSMLVLLPKNGDLTSLEESLTLEQLNLWRSGLFERRVDVFIPRFRFTTEYSLAENLAEMGMPTAFSRGADFSGIDGTRSLCINFVVQKAFVDVNEKGTEAAAATAVGIIPTCVSVTPVFNADHPFLFLIQDRGTGNILFLGRVIDPTQ